MFSCQMKFNQKCLKSSHHAGLTFSSILVLWRLLNFLLKRLSFSFIKTTL